jgi:hypothetical protein
MCFWCASFETYSNHLVISSFAVFLSKLWAMGAAVTVTGAGAAPTVIIGASNVAECKIECNWFDLDLYSWKMLTSIRSLTFMDRRIRYHIFVELRHRFLPSWPFWEPCSWYTHWCCYLDEEFWGKNLNAVFTLENENHNMSALGECWGHYHHWGGASNAGSYLLIGKN